MIFDLVYAGIEPDLLAGLVSGLGLRRSSWGEPAEVFKALDADPARRFAIAKALGYLPREHGPLDSDVDSFIRVEAHKRREALRTPEAFRLLEEELDALEQIDACEKGVKFVRSCGGIAAAWKYADALGQTDYKKWLRSVIDGDIVPDTLRNDLLFAAANYEKPLETCDHCGRRNIDPDAEAYSEGWSITVGADTICGGCYEEHYTSCEECEETISIEYSQYVTIPAHMKNGRWHCETDMILCEYCAKEREKDAEKAKEEAEEEARGEALALTATGFARWAYRNSMLTVDELEYVLTFPHGGRMFSIVYPVLCADIRLGRADRASHTANSILSGMLTQADIDRFSALPGYSPVTLESLVPAREFVRCAVAKARGLECVSV